MAERVLVCGGRGYKDAERLFAVLDDVHQSRGVFVVINGRATGADALSTEWALGRILNVWSFRADWITHGNAAGPLRNQRMLDVGNPTLVVAFPGGRGTADMVRRARKAGIEIMAIKQ
ncbi:MAG: hypothetical protein JWL61_4967 [Gemmatimonadetes bacterium]|nr:hypothetical protein [Gemmatimonadota bacterium]